LEKKIKVLQVISNFGIGGAEVWIIALLRYFKENADKLGGQFQTDVFLTNGVRDRLDGEAEVLGARLIYARYSRKTLPSFIPKWRRTLKEGNYAAIHDHQEFTAGWHFLFGWGHLPPIRIAHLHNPMSHQTSYATGFLRRQTIVLGNRLIAGSATHLLSTSRRLITEQGFDDLPAARNLPKLAVHCGFDPRRFAGDRASARRELGAEFNLPPDAKVMLFVGRLDSNTNEALNQKNPSFCLEVAKACAARSPDFVCLMAGGGDVALRILQERVKEWGLEDRIRLLGARSDIPRLMRGADVLLFPSLAEGLGMVAVEAQAAGLPVIASDAVPKECLVVGGMVDFLPLSNGASQWADVVLKRLVAPKPDHRMANQLVVESPFSIENSAKELIEIYQGQAGHAKT
jgi:glycosyltransferase involved in cell wall biosynthesis